MSLEVERFAEHLLAGDFKTAWDEIMQYTEAGMNSLFIYHRLLTQAMVRVGELWEQNRITVADEHLATSVCDALLTMYSAQFIPAQTPHDAPSALFFCLEHERHYLGLKMVASLFQENGWRVHFLGPDLPLEYAMASANRFKPDVIGMSVSIVYHVPQLKQFARTLQQLEFSPLLLVGGRLAKQYSLRPYCTEETELFEDLQDVHQWLLQPSQPREGASRHATS